MTTDNTLWLAGHLDRLARMLGKNDNAAKWLDHWRLVLLERFNVQLEWGVEGDMAWTQLELDDTIPSPQYAYLIPHSHTKGLSV